MALKDQLDCKAHLDLSVIKVLQALTELQDKEALLAKQARLGLTGSTDPMALKALKGRQVQTECIPLAFLKTTKLQLGTQEEMDRMVHGDRKGQKDRKDPKGQRDPRE